MRRIGYVLCDLGGKIHYTFFSNTFTVIQNLNQVLDVFDLFEFNEISVSGILCDVDLPPKTASSDQTSRKKDATSSQRS